MQKDDALIFDFFNGQLGKHLEDVIFDKSKNFELKNIDVQWNSKNLFVDNNGFFSYKDGENIYKTYSYLDKYFIDDYNEYPKAHITKCENILKYNGYKSTNKPLVSIWNRNSNQLIPELKLDVCDRCINNIQDITSLYISGKSWHSFLLDLEEDESTKEKNLRSDGYTTNWNQVSWALKEERSWQCEKCGWKAENDEHKFLHVHHKNGKKNNKRTDLDCLCILCHSEVDSHHRKKFSHSEKQMEIEYFKSKLSC